MSKLLDHVHLSRRFGYVYVDTPKVACSTIKRALQSAERGYEATGDGDLSGKFGYSVSLLDVHDRKKSPLKRPANRWAFRLSLAKARVSFCFVRNPYSRVLSAYLDKIAANETRRERFLQGLVEEPKKPISFREFLELIAKQSPHNMNAHWRPQRYHTMVDSLDYDFIGSFEALNDDLVAILKVAAPPALEFVKAVDEHRTSASEQLIDYYSDESAERLAQAIYEKDFEKFGYSTDLRDVTERPLRSGFRKK